MQVRVGSSARPMGFRVTRRTLLVGLAVLLGVGAAVALSAALTLLTAPLQFTQFSGETPAGLSTMADPQGRVTYELTLTNKSVIPIQVTGVEAVPGQPLSPVKIQVMSDERDWSQPLRPFTLPPLESVYLEVTSPAVCGARQDSMRVRYSIFGSERVNDLSLGGPITVEKFRCPSV